MVEQRSSKKIVIRQDRSSSQNRDSNFFNGGFISEVFHKYSRFGIKKGGNLKSVKPFLYENVNFPLADNEFKTFLTCGSVISSTMKSFQTKQNRSLRKFSMIFRLEQLHLGQNKYGLFFLSKFHTFPIHKYIPLIV